jgi:hypothetical protein
MCSTLTWVYMIYLFIPPTLIADYTRSCATIKIQHMMNSLEYFGCVCRILDHPKLYIHIHEYRIHINQYM